MLRQLTFRKPWEDIIVRDCVRRFAWIGMLCCLLVFLMPAVVVAGDWPMWRCDAGHTAASPDGLPPELHLRWTRTYTPRTPVWEDPLNQDIMSYDKVFEPIVRDGRMFVGFNDADKVVALDVDTGAELWAFYTDGPVRFSPVAMSENVCFASDDGYLYCVGAADGKLKWRFRGGPSARKVIGNTRVISAWPARGGPVLADGTVYFAASIWPFMGTFIYALDAETGEVRWVNEATGSQYMKQPHNAPSFAGVAPQGQLVVSGDVLLVPGGRSGPAAFDRHTGRQLYFNFGGKGQGGSFVAADQSRFFVHTRVRGTMAYRLSDGSNAEMKVNEPVLADGFVYAANTPGQIDGETAPAVIQAFDDENQLRWQVAADGSGDLIRAGNRLYAAGSRGIVAVELPGEGGRAEIAWSIPVEGRIQRLLAADEHLFAVTLDGRIMAFGAEQSEPAVVADPVVPRDPSPEMSEEASRLMKLAGAREGYALWFGVDDGRLLEAVLAASEFHVVAIDPDAEKIDRLRRRLDKAGLYGKDVALHQGDPITFQPPVYMATLAVVGRSMVPRLKDEKVLRRIYESVRPYGGKLWVPLAEEEIASFLPVSAGAELPNAELWVGYGGLMATRAGALPGAADWTHAYGDVANTVKSDDQRVRLPLGVLWFGGNSNMDILPRHGHGPSEQVIGGRLFIEGMSSISARDVYTGRVLWKREFEDLGTYDVYYDETYADTPLSTAYNQVHIPGANARGTNYVATEDGIYLVVGSSCQVLDVETGATLKEIRLPADDGGEPPLWGYIGVYEHLLLAGVGFGNYSDRLGYEYTPEGKRGTAWGPDRSGSLGLAAFDRHSGEMLWKVDARHSFIHNGIVAGGGRVYCLDKLPKRVEEQNARRGLDDPASYRLVALDAKTGGEVWSLGENVFGTWLGYSEKHDALLHAGASASDRSRDEVGRGMAVYRGADGSLLWEKPGLSYAGPCIIHNDSVITNTTSYKESKGAFHLLDGTQVEITDPVTGGRVPWRFTRTYGCNTAVASEHLLTFRSGAAGYYDLATHGGTGNFGGFKSGCSSSLIAANGLLNAPDYTRTCTCGYQNQTSLALVHMPENEIWTYNLFGADEDEMPQVRRIGVNLGAPGDRLAENGTLWVDYPSVGGSSPKVAVELAGEGELQWFRRHSSRISGDAVPWVGASGVEGVRSITVPVVLGGETDADEGIRVAHANDDAEESASGKVSLTSSDLELTNDGGPQTIGIRFPGLPVARGAKLTRAYVQFQVDESSAEPTTLQIGAQADDDAARFADKPFDISSRKRTSGTVRWEPKAWNANADPGPDHQTPDLAPILQEVFDRPGWKKGNAVALIITGPGKRVAEAFDGDKAGAPRLFVELEDAADVPEQPEPEITIPARPYTIRLHFVEPDETVRPGQRAFDVVLQGKTVLTRFDVAAQAGGALRSVVREFKDVLVAGEVSVVLTPVTDRDPVLCGIELVEEVR